MSICFCASGSHAAASGFGVAALLRVHSWWCADFSVWGGITLCA